MYLYELVNWLTTVVDSLQISDSYKDEAYRAATAYIAQCLMVTSFLYSLKFTSPTRKRLRWKTRIQDFLTDRTIERINENAIANILVDLDFLEEQFRGAGRANLSSLFSELRSVRPTQFFSLPARIYLFYSLRLLLNAPFIDDIYRTV